MAHHRETDGYVGSRRSDHAFLDFGSSKIAFCLFLIALAVRVAFLFVTPNNGVDAWARYVYAAGWLQHPSVLPSATSNDAWLPLHFWLLGGALWVWHSEWSARLLTLLMGALTVLPFWGAIRRIFSSEIAMFAALAFAFFGFHIGYSVTTSSEVPTMFFLVWGFYFWLRFHLVRAWIWGIASALCFSAASLCRFEAWLFSPILAILLLDYSHPWISLISNRRRFWQALWYGAFSSAGAIGWLFFSWCKWGDPLMLPHRTMAENTGKIAELHHALLYRLLVVPGSLFLSLGIAIALLIGPGIFATLRRRTVAGTSVVALSVLLFLFNYYNCVRYEVTQARYTLIYSWLFIPLAFAGLSLVTAHWQVNLKRGAPWAVILISIMWQGGIAIGSASATPTVADRLAVISPTLPIRTELRELVGWLASQDASKDYIVLDQYNYEGNDILRFARIDPALTFLPKTASYRDPTLRSKLENFVRAQKPRFLICSPDGPVGRALGVNHQEELGLPELRAQARRVWAGQHWSVYLIGYVP